MATLPMLLTFCLLPLRQEAERSAEEERLRLRLPLHALCDRGLGYARDGDLVRAAKVLDLLRAVAGSFDRERGSRTVAALDKAVAGKKGSEVAEAILLLAYVDFADRMAAIGAGGQLDVTGARRLLLAATADYELLAPLVRLRHPGREGKVLDVALHAELRSLASQIPRVGPDTDDGKWLAGFQARAAAL
ncbi:MAG: hypothetical protein KDC98_17315, partial [Planctomycetes bacterium]|nr:hypothetical protein [Planctomycetota bacterium]